jgi:hypothetical protein
MDIANALIKLAELHDAAAEIPALLQALRDAYSDDEWEAMEAQHPRVADLIGWTTRTITPDMVGQQVAVFTSIEVKSASGRLRPEQRQWLEAVQAAGGIAGVARSVEDAARLTGDAHGV